MRKKVVKILIIWLVFNFQFVYAEEFNITSKNVILYNMNDQNILYELNSNEQVQIASLTKIMTTITAIEQVDNLEQTVPITKEALKGIEEYTQVGFQIGDAPTVLDLLYGVMLPSGADAANALAIHVSGSISKYVELMNGKAQELGLKNTHFDNPIGMDSEENYSTASDLAKLLIYSLKNETFKEIFEAREYTISCLNKTVKSTLISYSRSYGLDTTDITGAKSGFTDRAGLCLASTATIDDVSYLLVTLGADTTSRSNAVRDTLEIYNYYSSTYSYQQVMKKDTVLATIPIKWGKVKNYEIKATEDKYLYLENDIRKNKIKYEYNGIEELKYGMKQGDQLGTITVTYRNEELATYDVYLDSKIEYYHPILYALIIIALLLMFYSFKLMRRRKKKVKKVQSKKKNKKNT
ncbi:MAG: serine hydrolase [Erysipelotrichaceae bacterium]|nr:serine hydrolase [Erysipelotrichaceae bacterium]